MTTVFKHQSYCDPGCYPSSSSSYYGGHQRGRRGSTGSCYGRSHVISYVPSYNPYCGSGYGRCSYYPPLRSGYGSGCYNQGSYGCYPYGRSLNGYGSGCYNQGSYGFYPYGYGQGNGCYGGYGGFGSSGCYGYGSGSNYNSSCYGRRLSCSVPCYNNGHRRYSISYNPCNPCL